jgi:hypothetical protein
MFEFLKDIQATFKVVTISTYGPNPKSDALVTIGDLLIATEFILVFGGRSMTKDEYDAEIAVRTIGNFISR